MHETSLGYLRLGWCEERAGGPDDHACHVHLIPRRYGNTPNPRGGVRGVIRDKMAY
jgi:ATP adenylyltransferase